MATVVVHQVGLLTRHRHRWEHPIRIQQKNDEHKNTDKEKTCLLKREIPSGPGRSCPRYMYLMWDPCGSYFILFTKAFSASLALFAQFHQIGDAVRAGCMHLVHISSLLLAEYTFPSQLIGFHRHQAATLHEDPSSKLARSKPVLHPGRAARIILSILWMICQIRDPKTKWFCSA
jgi:hypothetical protein